MAAKLCLEQATQMRGKCHTSANRRRLARWISLTVALLLFHSGMVPARADGPDVSAALLEDGTLQALAQIAGAGGS